MESNVSSMETPRHKAFAGHMTNTNERTILVLGGTGKTGRRIAPRLAAGGAVARAAARTGGDVRFDWHDPATHGDALAGVDAVYLVPPALRLDFPPVVGAFLDRAEAAGVRHVTFLSARGVDQAPPEVPLRAVELDLASRAGLSHTVIRPGWFMQNFSESFFQYGVAAGVLDAPTGDGAEAFVHADDIADVAAATLLDPSAHAGAGYTLTGPEALTMAEVAEQLSVAIGRPIVHAPVDRDEWTARTVAAGVPEPYAQVLAGLLDAVRSGAGSTTTEDVERVTGHAPRSFADYVADPVARSVWASVTV